MKKKLMAAVVCVSMLFTSLQLPTPALAEESGVVDIEELEESSEGSTVYFDAASEDEYDEIERIRETDFEIPDTDVDVMYVDWGDDNDSDQEKELSLASEVESHEIVLVLDSSGSMSGTPMKQLKKACNNFVNDILAEDEKAMIAIVDYNNTVTVNTFSGENFTNNKTKLRKAINALSAGGGTAMNAGLMKADELLSETEADQKFIIQMADGSPNGGATYYGSDARYNKGQYVDPDGNTFSYGGSRGYESAIYETFKAIESDYNIFSLGFFHSMRGTSKQFAATFMNDIQNQGYTEVTDADSLTFSFEDIANNISSEHIKLNRSSLALNKGDKSQLIVSFTDSYTSNDRTISWSSSNENVVKVTDSGLVTAVGRGTAVITASAGGYTASCRVNVGGTIVITKRTNICVYENKKAQTEDSDKYVLSKGAKITYDGTEYTTDSKGKAEIINFDSGEIEISKDGYKSKYLTPEQLEKLDNKVWLEKESDNPTLNAVWINGKNALQDEVQISLTESDPTSIKADIDWGKNSYGKIKLVQKLSAVEFGSNESSISLVLKDKFDISSEIYLLIEDAAGHSIKRKLGISVDGTLSGLEGMKLDIGDGKLTLPDSVPFIGGSELNYMLDNDKLPIKISIEDGKVKGVIGIDSDEFKCGDEGVDEKEEVKWIWEKLKKAKKTGNTKNVLKDIKSRYKITKYKGSAGGEANIELTGYFEGYIDKEGGFKFLDGGIVAGASAGMTWGGQSVTPVIPIPWYWEAALKGELESKLNLVRASDYYTADASLDITLTGSIEVGAGVRGVAQLGGGGKLILEPKAEVYSDKADAYMECTVTLNVYVKAKALLWEKEWELDPPLAEKKFSNDNLATSSSGENETRSENNFFDQDSYKRQDLSYLEDSRIKIQGSSDSDDIVLRDNCYEETDPAIVGIDDDTAFAAWVDGVSEDPNDLHIYYSYFNGSSWSDPEIVDDDGTPDFAPSLATDGSKVYLAWMDMNRSVTDEDTLSSVAGNMDIKAAVYNPSSHSFSIKKVTDDNGYLDMMPEIAATSDDVAVAFVENKEGSYFDNNGGNEIYISKYEDGEWNEAEKTDGDLNMVNYLALDINGTEPHAAYAVDTDSDSDSISDIEIYLDGKRITDNDLADSAPFFKDNILYYNSNGNIIKYDYAGSAKAETLVSDIGTGGRFEVLSYADESAILYRKQEGMAGVMNVIFHDHDSDKWGEAVEITDADADITNFGGFWGSKGFKILCNSVQLTSKGLNGESGADSYGKSSIIVKNIDFYEELTLENIFYDKDDIEAGSALPASLCLKNSGTKKIESVKVQVKDADGNEKDSTEYSCDILPGAEEYLDISFMLDEDDLGKNVTVICNPADEDQENTDINSKTIELSYNDLAVDSLSWGLINDENAEIYGFVKNNSLSDADNIKVELRKGSEDGELIESYSIGSLAAGESADISYQTAVSEAEVYYVTVSAEDFEDENVGNDSDFVLVTNETDSMSGRTVKSISVSKNKTD
ncbi:MAG: VWA domain-containing protein, partial [Lachnospiraceae bacterium]|nr:VWA domain-containing protein [Lachnospiraceae bacterium]